MTRDSLTGLPDRAGARGRLAELTAAGVDVALVLLDLDRFKVLNDGLGHDAGDRLLVQVAERLRAAAGPGDVVARIGGDEFAVLLVGTAEEPAALAAAERLLAAVHQPVHVGAGPAVLPHASAGVAVAERGATADALVRAADTAMYAAKAAGGGRVRLSTPELHEAALRAHQLEVELRAALQHDELALVFQPVVDLTTGRTVACEALVRWVSPERGPVDPAEFVAVAEQSDLVVALGDWVLERALQQAALWQRELRGSAPGVAVNVSMRQLLDPALPQRVAQTLARCGVGPERLTLEVTESALVEDTRPVVAALQALRDVGVRLAIDDFGTGHASLTYLAQLPVDVVKIDRSFVAGVDEDAGSAAIVSGVVAMAEAFGLRVVAEGVEVAGQLTALRRARVHEVQGFLLSHPLPPDQLLHRLTAALAEQSLPLPRTPAIPADVAELDAAGRFRLLLDAARDLTACVQLDDVLARTFSAMRTFVRFSGGSVQLVDGDVLRLAATDPPATPEALTASIPMGTGVGGTIAVTGEPRYLPDITIVSAVPAERRRRSTSTGVRSYYGVPLVAEGRIVGVLQIDSTDVDAFSDADRLLVLSFASVVASAVTNVRLFERELGVLQQPPS